MPYDERLAQKVRSQLKKARGITEKKMFGGLCFLLRGHMCCGVERDKLVVRVGPEQYEPLLRKQHVKPMDFTGKPLRGFVYVMPDGLKSSAVLKTWVAFGLQYAKSLPVKK